MHVLWLMMKHCIPILLSLFFGSWICEVSPFIICCRKYLARKLQSKAGDLYVEITWSFAEQEWHQSPEERWSPVFDLLPWRINWQGGSWVDHLKDHWIFHCDCSGEYITSTLDWIICRRQLSWDNADNWDSTKHILRIRLNVFWKGGLILEI